MQVFIVDNDVQGSQAMLKYVVILVGSLSHPNGQPAKQVLPLVLTIL